MVGAPAQPMAAEKFEAIRALLSGLQEVEEAHLPQMFAPGAMQAPGQVLVAVFKDGSDAAAVMEKLDLELKKLLPEAEYLDIFPVSKDHILLEPVRNSGCRIK